MTRRYHPGSDFRWRDTHPLVKVEDRLKYGVCRFYRGKTLSSSLTRFPLFLLHCCKYPDFSGFHRPDGIISQLRDVRSKKFSSDRRYARHTRPLQQDSGDEPSPKLVELKASYLEKP